MKILTFFKKTYSLLFLGLFGRHKFARFKGVKFGRSCRLYIINWGSEPWLINLGDNVTVTAGCRFITHDGSTCLVYGSDDTRYQRFGEINVGNNVFIGVNSIVMPGVNIGNDIVIGAGSVVTKDLQDGYVYVGVPAKPICTLAEYSAKIKRTCSTDGELVSAKGYREKIRLALELQSLK